MKRIIVTIALLVMLVLLSVACSLDNDEMLVDSDLTDSETISWVPYGLETYIYLSERVHINISAGGVLQGSMLHGNTIYYYYVSMRSIPDTHTVVASHNIDTGAVERMVLPFSSNIEVAEISVTDEGNITVFALEFSDDEDDYAISTFYSEFDMEGNQLYIRYFDELLDYDAGTISIEQVIFTGDHIVLLISYLELRQYRSSIHIIDMETTDVEVLYSDIQLLRGSIAYLGNGRLAARELLADGTLLWEINIDDGVWGDVIATIDFVVFRVFYPGAGNPFDLMMTDENYLFGYNVAQGEPMALLNFAQSEIHRVNDIGFFDDGRIYVLSIFWNTDGEQEVNLYILTPVEREVFDERILLTLGGVNIGTDTYQAVARFNISSSTHEIIVEEYNLTGDLMEGTRDAFSRLEIDLITGRGPDIIYNVWGAVLDRGMLLDLHPFIHADAGLSIEDFVPSFLASLESPDGSLYMLASEFWIDTMVGNAEVIGHIDIESWTIEASLELLEANSHMELPLGAWMTSEQFVHIMLRAEADYFVCQTTLTANFDNEAFINILEMAKIIHDSTDVTVIETLPHGYFRLLYGDQLLLRFAAFSADNYFLFSTVNEDLTVLGFPTTSGGVHITFPYSSPLGINAATEHPDAAWEFLRHMLLPRDNLNLNFPIRMDMFEDIIENRTTPLLELDEEGNSMEVSLGSVDFGDGTIVRLYSATEEAVETLRYVVEAAQPDDSLMAGELWFSVLIEDLAPFLAETRTVEDTVRIMQNRAQTFLNERG